MSSSPQPPQPAPVWNHTPDRLIQTIDHLIKSSNDLLATIEALPTHERNFGSVILPLAKNDTILQESESLTFYQFVSTDPSIRQAAIRADKLIQDHQLNSTMRVEIYRAILDAQLNSDPSTLDEQSKRLIDKLIQDRTQNGLQLPDSSRQSFDHLQRTINHLTIDFQNNLNQDLAKLWFEPIDLRGVPEDVLSGFERDDRGRLAMSFKSPDYVPVMQYAINPETRKRASLGYDSKASQNLPILQEIISLRRRAAHTLGQPNWATHALNLKMAKDPKTVNEFLDDLRQKLIPIAQRERTELLKLKAEEIETLNIPNADPTKLFIWDYNYYLRLYTEKHLDLKSELVKEYFPVSVVVKVILETYQSLLSVKFFQVDDPQLWHPNVTQWSVWESQAIEDGSANQGNGFLGHLYLDLEPRPNKYGHAAVWGLLPGYEKEDGSRHYPVAAMVANLAKGTPQKPALMTHDNVVTFFHEMGHVFHQLCSKTKYSRFHGTNVARDFVEAPSQMLENWCWNESQLLKMSQHYERQDEKLPKELIDKIIASQDLNSGLINLRQIFFGMFDMFVHTTQETDQDLTEKWCTMRDEISLLDPSGEHAPGQTSFGHIVGGYDAGYYGYLYSKVFSVDMYETIFSMDPMSRKSGTKYREEILKPGGSRDEMISLTKFLSRPPNNEAFLRRLVGRQTTTA